MVKLTVSYQQLDLEQLAVEEQDFQQLDFDVEQFELMDFVQNLNV